MWRLQRTTKLVVSPVRLLDRTLSQGCPSPLGILLFVRLSTMDRLRAPHKELKRAKKQLR